MIFSKESEELKTVVGLLSQMHKRLQVEFEDRKTFLAPFIPSLIDPRKKRGLKDVKHFARTLHLLVDFKCAKGVSKPLDVDCIADEIYKLYNELYPKKDPVEENLFLFFRKPLPEDTNVKWIPASAILIKLNLFGEVEENQQTQLILVETLEKYEFRIRTNEQDITEYEVVDIQKYDVDRNFKQ